MKNIIEISNLNKTFKDVKAVQNLSLKVKEGELFAFLGLNGAGKSTTISIMCGQLKKDSGTVIIDGNNIDHNIKESKNRLGVVFQNSVLDKPLTVKENLKNRAALYGITGEDFIARLNELSNLLNLNEILNRPVGKLSGGQRRRADIARALLHKPKILILDEPTTGLDPQTRHTLWEVISLLRKQTGMTVFLTTHYMEEAADADYIVILDNGKVSADGTPLELKNKFTADYITLYGALESDVASLGYNYEKIKDAFRISIPNTSVATELIINNPNMFKNYEITKGKMDDVFLAVTGKSLLANGGASK
jgi:multidrug/hemolysin transport system ATP-binding protein